jgi:sugar O-acyltransferase (sialic acid O-acetyltransferase NeuD family)
MAGILLVGAGGHAQACIDIIESHGAWRIRGLLGAPGEQGGERLGYPLLGTDEDMASLFEEGASALVCVGQVKSPEVRMWLFASLRDLGYALPAIIAPTAWVSPHASIGAGSIIMHGAIVNAGATVGENCIINTRALVEHGAMVGDHCHVSTGALINGDVQVGEGSFIGSGSKIREGVRVGSRCIVGLGSSVFASIADGTTFRQAK